VTRNDGDPMGGLNSPLRVTHPPRERRHTAALRDSFGASNSPLPHRWLTPLPRRAAIGGGSTREMTYPPNDLFARFGTTPLPQKLPIAPIFIADSVSIAVSREKGGKLRLVYVKLGRCQGPPLLDGAHWLRTLAHT
jgi:hypothetical protein